MNAKELLYALNDVDEAFIEAAAPRRQIRWRQWGMLAACLTIVIALQFWTPPFLRMGNTFGAGDMKTAAVADGAFDVEEAPAEDEPEMEEAAAEDMGLAESGAVGGAMRYGAEMFPMNLSAVDEVTWQKDGVETIVTDTEAIAQAMELLMTQDYFPLEEEAEGLVELTLSAGDEALSICIGADVLFCDGTLYAADPGTMEQVRTLLGITD